MWVLGKAHYNLIGNDCLTQERWSCEVGTTIIALRSHFTPRMITITIKTILASTQTEDNVLVVLSIWCSYIVCHFKGSLVTFRLILIGDTEIATSFSVVMLIAVVWTSFSHRIRMIMKSLVIGHGYRPWGWIGQKYSSANLLMNM